MNKKRVLHLLNIYSRLIAAALCIAAGIALFLLPNKYSVGGVMGIAAIIFILTEGALSFGLLLVIINLPFLVVALKVLGMKFTLRTAVCVVFAALFVDLINHFNIANLDVFSDTQNAVLFSIAGGALVSLGLVLTFTASASSGGSDIVGVILQRKYAVSNVSRFLIASEVAVVAVLALCLKDFGNFMYSCTAVFASEILFQMLQGGLSSAVAFEVITEKPEEMCEALSDKLGRGTTAIKAMGMYNKTEKNVVICVVHRRQEAAAKKLIKEIDGLSFAYSLPIKEVLGKGFNRLDGMK